MRKCGEIVCMFVMATVLAHGVSAATPREGRVISVSGDAEVRVIPDEVTNTHA